MVPQRDDLRPEASGGVSLWYIATRAGVSGRSDNWILNYVRMLVANDGFPSPLPNYSLSRRRKLTGILYSSRWLRTAVDAWFDGFLPPQLVGVVEDRQLQRDAALLDQRAEALAEIATLGARACLSGSKYHLETRE